MNISLLETARRNRIVALENLRIKKQVNEGSGHVLSLQTMRELFYGFTTLRYEGETPAAVGAAGAAGGGN